MHTFLFLCLAIIINTDLIGHLDTLGVSENMISLERIVLWINWKSRALCIKHTPTANSVFGTILNKLGQRFGTTHALG